MYSVLRNFIEVYLKEIISTFNNDKFEIYYKGKYSDINKTLTLFEEIVKTERIAINVINEYSKINFGKGLKFDIAISQPFTSSYYNFKIISNESIYYIPNKYLDFIPKGIRGACYGVNDLRTKIRTIMKKTGDNISSENADWKFSGEMVNDFENHVSKSVPIYKRGHEIIIKLSDFFVKKDSLVYDINMFNREFNFEFSKA